MSRVVGRRTLWTSALLLVAVQSAHLLARGTTWMVDAVWAVDSYLFSMIFFGPAIAAVATAYGRQLHRIRWLARVRPDRALAAHAGELAQLGLGVFAAGLATALVLSLRFGAPLAGGMRLAWQVVAALLGIVAYASVGLVAGFHWRSLACAPIVAVVAFALTMAAWLGGFESIVRFGGATAGVATLVFRDDVLATRTLLFTSVAVAAGAHLLVRLRPTDRRRVRSVGRIAAIGTVGAAFYAWPIPNVFAEREVTWRCLPGGELEGTIEVCVADRFDWLLPEVQQLSHDLGLLDALYAASPDRVGPRVRVDDSSLLYLTAQRSSPPSTKAAMLFSGYSQGATYPYCQASTDDDGYVVEPPIPPDGRAAWQDLNLWLSMRFDDRPKGPFDGFSSLESLEAQGMPIGDLQSEATQQWLRDRLSALPPCQ